MPDGLYFVLVIALIINNVVWMIYLRGAEQEANKKEQTLLNRIQAPNYLTPLSDEKTEIPERPGTIQDQYFDPEYEAVGKIDPTNVEQSRNGN